MRKIYRCSSFDQSLHAHFQRPPTQELAAIIKRDRFELDPERRAVLHFQLVERRLYGLLRTLFDLDNDLFPGLSLRQREQARQRR